MTKAEIIRMAEQAGFVIDQEARKYQPNCISHTHYLIDEQLTRFEALVRADEREACAKVCDEWPHGRDDVCLLADAIRARGERWCDECRNFDHNLLTDQGEGSPCTKGHKPRFYTSRTMSQVMNEDWGWKRKCEDFERKWK